MKIELTEEEINSIKAESLQDRCMYRHEDIYISGDIDNLVQSLNDTRDSILKVSGVDPQSISIESATILDEYEDRLTHDGLRICYEMFGYDKEYYDKAIEKTKLIKHNT